MKQYRMGALTLDVIELKCLLVSKGVRVAPEVYEQFSGQYNISPDARRLSCILLSDGTVTSLNDMEPMLSRLGERYYWTAEEKKQFNPQLETPFFIRPQAGKPALFFHDEFLDFITFPAKNDFYDQCTSTGRPFLGAAALQGTDWLTLGYLWPCDFAKAGYPCQYCHCGRDTMARVRNKVPFDPMLTGAELCEMIRYGVAHAGSRNVQITGGSTLRGETEQTYFRRYLDAINQGLGRTAIPGDLVFYITPPEDVTLVDYYLDNGADQIGCSVEIWDEELAKIVTPGKMRYTTRQRHLDVLQHIVERYGPHHAFCNFVVGPEPIESLREGATWLAERGITPAVSVWQPAGLRVAGNITPPGLDYYRRVKELFLNLYEKYDLRPAEQSGENGCIEEEFFRAVREKRD